MIKSTYKKIQLFLTVLTLLVFFSSLYFQYVVGLHPCPLCLMQRLCIFLLLILLGLSLRTVKKAHVVSLMQVVVAGAGLVFALRQLWLQLLPAGSASACMPGLEILIKYFPWQTVARALFWGTGACGEVTWSLFGVSMAGWSGLYFLVMVLFSLLLYGRTADK
ncbi:MAG: disulfide bond formation protein B [Legionellales bacterium]